MYGPATVLARVLANGRVATLLEGDVSDYQYSCKLFGLMGNAHKSNYIVYSQCYIQIVYKMTSFPMRTPSI